MTVEGTLRDRARGAVRDEVISQAWLLFSTQGFEATTVDQVATASGMSRRTFFRYFSGKDELLLERIVASGEQVAGALRARPAEEDAWTALRAAFADMAARHEEHQDRARPLVLMLRDEPGVRAGVLERRRAWEALLTPLVAERLPARAAGARGADARAAAVTAAALSCFQAAQETWATHPGARLVAMLDEAMATVARLGP